MIRRSIITMGSLHIGISLLNKLAWATIFNNFPQPGRLGMNIHASCIQRKPKNKKMLKRIFFLMLVILWGSLEVYAQKDKHKIEAAISKFFDGISEIDSAKMKAFTTSDFILLESGEVWNLDTLVTKIRVRKNSGIKRVNSFQFIKTEQNGRMAWVSYRNTADFTMNDKQQTVKWLESAVLKQQNGQWKICLLHSTRIGAAK